MNKEKHQELLKDFLAKGGNARVAKSIERFSLQNYAKLKYEWSKIQTSISVSENNEPTTKVVQKIQPSEVYKPKSSVFDELILDYPTELHSIYRRRWEIWLEACSWKMRLNETSPKDEKKAFEIQWIIYTLFQEFDQCQTILGHYREHKRIMTTESKRDFSQMSELELFKERNNLRTLITRRRQTIEKLEATTLPKEGEEYKWQHSINRKREQLQEKINELREIEKILNNNEKK